MGFAKDCQGYAEAGVGGFGAGDGVEHQVDRRAGLDGLDLRGDVGEHAALQGDFEVLPPPIICHRRISVGSEPLAGLIPTVASPEPYSRPSSMLAAMPRTSSVG